ERRPGTDMGAMVEDAMLRDLQKKRRKPVDDEQDEGKVKERARDAHGKLDDEHDGRNALDDHERHDNPRNSLLVAALIEHVVLPSGEREKRVMDDLHEPDDAGEHRGDERVSQ